MRVVVALMSLTPRPLPRAERERGLRAGRLSPRRLRTFSGHIHGNKGPAMSGHIFVIDQGTTSTRAIVFDVNARPIAIGQEKEFRQDFPQPGSVEHDPEDIWRSTLSTIRAALAKADIAPGGIVGIGIANQRETTLVWNSHDGTAASQRDRMAGPAHRADLRAAEASSAMNHWRPNAPAC